MINSSLRQLAALLRERKLSSVEVATEFLQRIKALNPKLNAFVSLDEGRTLGQARAADALLAAAPQGHGIANWGPARERSGREK